MSSSTVEKRSLISISKPAKKQKLKKFKPKPIDPTGPEAVLRNDIRDLLLKLSIDPETAKNDMTAFFNRDRQVPWSAHKQVEMEIQIVSSSGSGIGLHDGKPVVVPFSLPGDVLEVKIYRTEEFYFEGEIVEVTKPSPQRDDSLVRCQYFTKCSGCQFQMTNYDNQLQIKQNTVVNAYRHFAPNLWKSGRLPKIHSTFASPLAYNYRTKLTPHFDVKRPPLTEAPPIGFGEKGRNSIVDIEECSIGVPIVNVGMKQERARIHEDFSKYKKGVTLLLRENQENGDECVTDPKQVIEEVVDGKYKFRYKAGTFFQNNNSILPIVTEFVRNNIQIDNKPPKYLVDTYCGCGLFGITCSPAVESVIGVEISAESVEFANQNAELNKIKNAKFIVGEAERIFEHVKTTPEETAIIIDPPRKGCDNKFLDQLVEFSPAKVVYVSCNVHSQARDLEYLLQRTNYKVESLGGFDFFPQTHHVEGVAVLSL